MSQFVVEKMIWEYGEEYNHVYYPTSMADLKVKVNELADNGKSKDYSHLIQAYLRDGSIRGFTVGHDLCWIEFGYSENQVLKGPYYLLNSQAAWNETFEFFYFAPFIYEVLSTNLT